MKASEIIKELTKYIAEYGDQEVYLYTDHGQTDSLVRSVDYLTENNEDLDEPFISIYGE